MYMQYASTGGGKRARSICGKRTEGKPTRKGVIMSASENVETAKKAYEAFSTGDLETAMNTLDDNIEWINPGDSKVSGTFRGKQGFMDLVGKLAEKSFTTRPSRFLVDDDVVVVLTEVNAGGESATEADVLTFRDGKVVKAQTIADTAMTERVYGKK
jgi:ketosteroid isomerase-like protein